MKEAWEVNNNDWPVTYKKIELTGRCKVTEGGPNPRKYYEVMRNPSFGRKPWTEWVKATNINFYEEEKTTIYQCTCLEDVKTK